MNELIEKVEQWAIDKGLHEADPKVQALKVVEEFTEMLLAEDDEESRIDGVGDTYVTLIILCQQLDLNFKELLATAESWNTRYFKITPTEVFVPLNGLSTGVSKNSERITKKGIVGLLAILERVLEGMDFSSSYCLDVAYNEIKDRTGKMVGGTFVKDSDL